MFKIIKKHWVHKVAIFSLAVFLWIVGISALHSHSILEDSQSEQCNLCLVQHQLQDSLQTSNTLLISYPDVVSFSELKPYIDFSTNCNSFHFSRAPPQA